MGKGDSGLYENKMEGTLPSNGFFNNFNWVFDSICNSSIDTICREWPCYTNDLERGSYVVGG